MGKGLHAACRSASCSLTGVHMLPTRRDAPVQDEVLDVLYWWRQLVGLFFGLVWGIAPLTGWYAFAG